MNESLYNEIIQYCKKRLFFKKLNNKISYLEIAHNVISSPLFDTKPIYYLVDKYIYEELQYLKTNVSFQEIELINTLGKAKIQELLLRCKKCLNDYPYSYYKCVNEICCACYRDINKSRINANSKKSYYKNREKNKYKDRERCKEYRKKNKVKVSAYNKAYKEKNREKIKEYNKIYYRNKKQKPLNK